MLKRIINKIKYHLIKEIVLVDSENIGYQIPEEIPKHTLVYLFISDPYIDEKIKDYKNNKHIKLINISNIRKECITKNIMDFCIVVELTNLLSYVSKKTRIVICSKDRGYDASILYLKEKDPKHSVSRHPGSFCYYYNEGNEDYLSIMSKVDDSLRKKILSYTCMDSLKYSLSKNEKKLFVVEEYINTIGMVKTFIEFDIYQMSYELYYSGTHVGSFENKEDALYEYHQCIEKLHHIYDKYESHERFLKSRHFHIRHYIEEASMQNLPLEEGLINHLGKEQGHSVYKEYVSLKVRRL